MNKKSYLEEIFEMCGFTFRNEKYILETRERSAWPVFKHPLIGINTGSGDQWVARRWPESEWIRLARGLGKAGYGVLVLGGSKEDKMNRYIARMSGARYPGHFGVGKFVDLVGQCDLVITGVTMALHIAIALKKKVVLLNNIFNSNEFDLYGLGRIVEPPVPCLGCYSPVCEKRFNGKRCTELVDIEEIINICRRLIPVSRRKRS
jgi:heptosyltransferase-2